MFSLRYAWMLLAALALAGCEAVPQIQSGDSNMSMAVRAKAPFVAAVSYSRDGAKVATGSADQALRLWDMIGVKQLMLLKGNSGVVTSVVYAPDGKFVAVAAQTISSETTTLWDAADGKKMQQISGMGGELSLSADGRFLLGSANGLSGGILKLWDVQANSLVREFKYDNNASGTLSPDGKYVATCALSGSPFSGYQYHVSLVSTATGREIWSNQITCGHLAFSPDGRQLLLAYNRKAGAAADLETAFKLFDAASGRQLKEIGRAIHPSGGAFSVDYVNHIVAALAFSPDGRTFLSGDQGGHYKLWDVASGEMLRQFRTVDEIAGSLLNVSPSMAFSPDGRIAIINSLAAARLYSVATGEELAALIGFENGEWLVTTPSGYYNASGKGDQYLEVAVGGKPYTIAQLRESFFRPDLVKLALSGSTLSDFRRVADIKPPPAVAIVDTPASANSDEVTVSLRVTDQGGGIGDVRLYRNGAAVLLEKTRNLQVESGAQGGQVMRYAVRLEAGKNSIRAVAFNADNSMQSSDATLDIEAKFSSRPPALYAVVVGIKDYVNPRLALTYPVADAELFADTLGNRSRGLFDNIRVRRLLKPEETTSTAIAAALQQAQKEVRPEDLFVFYVASHGTVDDGQYFLITSNVGSTSTARLKADALSQDALKEMISNIPAAKKLVVLDTCNAGKMGDALQMAMMTRGMSEDTAMKVLSRAVGSTILSAATSVQEALEGYQEHGLFTWVVAQGLNGAADADSDGFVKTLELADYVDDQVPELADKVFNHKQFPIVSPTGQGFPLTRTR